MCLNKGWEVLSVGACFGGAGGMGARRGSAPALCSPATGFALCLVHLVLAARALSLHRVAVGWVGCRAGLQVFAPHDTPPTRLPFATLTRAPSPPRLGWSQRTQVGQAFLILLCYFDPPEGHRVVKNVKLG